MTRTLGTMMRAAAVVTMLVVPAIGADPADGDRTGADVRGIEFFETRIRPVLVQHCYECHSEQAGDSVKGGLRLDTRRGIRAGGDSGHAVVPNEVEHSVLISALRYEDFEMPPTGRLDASIVSDFESWIEMGAPDPRVRKPTNSASSASKNATDLELGGQFWAFQPVRTVEAPHDETNWAWTDIDRFLVANHRRAGVRAVDDASATTLLRRVYFDLVGLPPSPAVVKKFEQSPSPAAFTQIVDQLLNSREFGQRWGRHWLDIVRYAESTGRTRNFPYPFAWRYRDYVIQSFNDDKPYDQFLREQIAGDLLDSKNSEQRDEQLIATGFLAMGAYDLNERNTDVYRMDQVGDQLDVIGRSMMGLTIGCARCHDHKFDPIPTDDYYALAGIFRNTTILNGYTNRRRNNQMGDPNLYVELKSSSHAHPNDADARDDQIVKDQRATDRANRAAERISDRIRLIAQLERRLKSLRKQQANRDRKEDRLGDKIQQLKSKLSKAQQAVNRLQGRPGRKRRPEPFVGPYAMGVRDSERIGDCPLHISGDVTRLGEEIPRGFLRVVQFAGTPEIPKNESGRMQFAEWLTRGDHPLTSRVMVNRVWHHLIGRGIVETVDNFGAMGTRPSHADLLDFLAKNFVQDGWSVKRLIRSIVLSRAYRLSSDSDETNVEIDADNRMVWRMPLRRLEAEAIRDAILSASGQLNTKLPLTSPVQELPIAQIGNGRRLVPDVTGFNYRSVYWPIVRARVPGYLTTFDFPEPSDVQGDRDVTTVATQALFMMNSPIVAYHSRLSAERVLRAQAARGTTSPRRDMVREAYLLTLNRRPTERQLQRVLDYVQHSHAGRTTRPKRARLIWLTDLIHALIASAEFRYR